MRPTLRPLARHVSGIVLASAAPASWVAAALAASFQAPSGANALLLTMGVIAMLAGISVSILMTRQLCRALDDLAADAEMVSRERPPAHVDPVVREVGAIADGLAAAAMRMQQARARRGVAEALRRHAEAALELAHSAAERGAWRWDLATGAMEWSAACNVLFRVAADGAPPRTQLLALAHPSSRADLVAWLAHLARGEEAAPLAFRITRGDGAMRMIRATAAVEYDSSDEAIAIAGSFEDIGEDRPASTAPRAAEAVPAGDANALLQALAAHLRPRAHAAGIDFAAAIMPGLGPLHDTAQALDDALALLGESVLTVTPRGGRVLLRADPQAGSGLSIAFGCYRPAGSDGMELAGHMIELNCGTLAAKRIEEARARLASIGGTLTVARTTAGSEAVTLALPGARRKREAA
jgi:PAS domain-containing protein